MRTKTSLAQRFTGVFIFLLALIIYLPESCPATSPVYSESAIRAEYLQVASDSPLIVSGEIRRAKLVLRNLCYYTIRITEIHRNAISDIDLQPGQEFVFRAYDNSPRSWVQQSNYDERKIIGVVALWMLQLAGDGHFYCTRKDSKSCVASAKWSSWLQTQLDGVAPLQRMSKWQWINREPRKFNVSGEERRRSLEKTVPILDRLMEGGKFHRERLSEIQTHPLEIRIELAVMDQITARLDDDGWCGLKLYLLEKDKSAKVRLTIVSTTGRLFIRERAEVKAAFVKALGDESPQVRMFACQSLMFCEDRSCASAVAKLLNDGDRQVRTSAVRTLGWIGSPEHTRDILRVYESKTHQPSDEDKFADALSRLGEQKTSLRAAMKCMNSSQNWNARYFAVRALKFNKSQAVVSALIHQLAPELSRTCSDMREHRVGDRVLKTICDELEKRTRQKFGCDVAAWLKWWDKQCAEYASAPVDIDYQKLQKLTDESVGWKLLGHYAIPTFLGKSIGSYHGSAFLLHAERL